MKEYQIVRVQGAPIGDNELIADLKRVSEVAGTTKVTQALYSKHGQFDVRNLARRFGTWNKALRVAGLSVSNEISISDERLFVNILSLWQHYGRQPRRAELARSPSSISQGAYRRRFRSWMDALQNFAAWANSNEDEAIVLPPHDKQNPVYKTGRSPSLRLRFQVMLRDRFTCRHCGASPAKGHSVELHVDHINPWSKGGDTVLENLQTLCSKCNLGKSNMTS